MVKRFPRRLRINRIKLELISVDIKLVLTDQVAFFGVRILNPSVKRYVTQELRKSNEKNEKGKKKQYNERILKIEHGTFTPIVMSTTGGMGRESRKCSAHFSEIISKKNKRNLCIYCFSVKKKNKFCIAKFS